MEEVWAVVGFVREKICEKYCRSTLSNFFLYRTCDRGTIKKQTMLNLPEGLVMEWEEELLG